MAKTFTDKDIERLKEIRKSIMDNVACSYEKEKVLEYINSIIEPKCAVCRRLIESDMIVVNERKMHPGCEKRYTGH